VVDRAFKRNGGQNPTFNGQFNSDRFAFLFKPGTHNVNVNVGFYTSVIGLGISPAQTVLQGLRVENGDPSQSGGALCNFWRSAENVATRGDTMWSVSQACPLRRMVINGNLALSQPPGYSSGGYLADSTVTGTISSGTQQQWLTRNSKFGNWNGGAFNMVFVGNTGAQTRNTCGGAPEYTTVAQTPVIAEKPYLAIANNGSFSIRVPRVETNKAGPTSDFNNVDVIDFSNVYVATSQDSAAKINGKLSQGRHLLLTPGIYKFSEPIVISNPNTVVLGIGFPTLTATNGNALIRVTDVDGVRVGGILLEAGPVLSPSLLLWGNSPNFGNASNPGFMYDIFGRTGGTNNPNDFQAMSGAMVTINHAHVVFDNSWLWRADHDIVGNVGNSQNPSKNGLVVNGDSVIAYGLATEHHLADGIVWNGNNGKTYFFQCELPYDVTQQQFGNPGYVGYRVGRQVTAHEAYGVGVYTFFRDHDVTAVSGFSAPTTPNIKFVHPFTWFLSGNGGVRNVLNNQGNSVNGNNRVSYIC